MLLALSTLPNRSRLCCVRNAAIDDPAKVTKVIACDRAGEQKEISYTNCKIIGNGSFGVVFQARLVGANPGDDDIAIKKVLQDKRFKVRRLKLPHQVSYYERDSCARYCL